MRNKRVLKLFQMAGKAVLMGVASGYALRLAANAQLVAAGVGEMKPPAARISKYWLADDAPGRFYRRLRLLQRIAPEHHQGAAGRHGFGAVKPTRELPILKGHVIGPVLLERPPKSLRVESFGRGQVRGRKLDVKDGIVDWFAHFAEWVMGLRQ